MQVVQLEIEKSTPKMTILHKSKISSLGKSHFACLTKTNEKQTSNNRSNALNSFDIFYTNDRGVSCRFSMLFLDFKKAYL